MSLPSSQIYICSNVKLTNDYIHSIYFPNINAQDEYFSGKVVYTFSDYTYLRKSWNIKVNATMQQARKWCYLYFINDNKRWYYFIKNIEYVNDNCVELWLELDVIQTYMFEWGLSRCFVEREHVRDDTVGKHLIDEGLQTGEFIVKSQVVHDLGSLCVLIMCSVDPNSPNTRYGGLSYHGVFSGVGIYAVHHTRFSELSVLIGNLDDAGKSDAIITMWMYPEYLVELVNGDEGWDDDEVCQRVKSVKKDGFAMFGDENGLSLSGYTPRNNKLLSYPYNFIYASNNMGDSAVYKYEYFYNRNEITFDIHGALSPDAKVFMYPRSYKNESYNYEEGLTLSGFPTCAWNQDIYKMYVAQTTNQNNVAGVLGLLDAGLGFAGGLITAGTGVGAIAGAGAVAHGLFDTLSVMARYQDMQVQPPQAKGSHSATINTAMNTHTFIFREMCITKEFAKSIDGFFDIYGYAVKTVKIPALKNRENWTYIKTVGCHVTGDFCTDDKNKIQRIFDNGITFWVDGDEIGNYTLDNAPLG